MHAVTAIKVAIKQKLTTDLVGVHVFRDRTRLLSEAASELPAIIIKQGSVDPFPSLSTFGKLGFVLNFNLELIDIGLDEETITDAMNELWANAHASIVPAGSLGLSYVIDVTSQGALEPDTTAENGKFVIALAARFAVAFTVDRNNPSV
jgi:hypothetical protein